ncbi:alcohol oxidase [Cubamyces sp. BRFM 1775]|nr:alcohol oxidase [Cubamyces sp. BRFM 1775]
MNVLQVAFAAVAFTLLEGWHVSATTCANLPRTSTAVEFSKLSFDYLVGGGTAGVALSARLAEDPSTTVGLIEAGDIHLNDPTVEVPARSGIGNASYDWLFTSVPQTHLSGRSFAIPRGKMLGGSSGINGMAWGRASSVEYDAWIPFASDSSWGWSGLLPYLRKCENYTLPPHDPFPGISEQDRERALHDLPHVDSFSGPIVASHNDVYFDAAFQMANVLNDLGIGTNVEPQSGNASGVTNTLTNINRVEGKRSYSANTYYCSHANDANYHVLLNAQATKVSFTKGKSPLVATGVEFVVGGKTYKATARREVILSAGTIQTPQLLELSGIGNSSILQSFGIKPLLDLPGVGENLQEHLFVLAEWQVKPGVQTFDLLRNNATFAAEQQMIYDETRGGLLAATDSLLAFLTLGDIVSSSEMATLLSIFDKEAAETTSPLTKLQNRFRREYFADGSAAALELIEWVRGLVDPAPGKSYVSVIGGMVHPSSKGSVHIASSNPLTAPAVDFNLLSSEFDTQLILQILKFLIKIGGRAPFADLVQVQTDPDPSLQTDEELLSYISSGASIGDHSVGTAPMAPKDFGGVVDNTLTVYGTANLRVVDASIIPIHIGAHIQSTIYAIAEKAADMIKHSGYGRSNSTTSA